MFAEKSVDELTQELESIESELESIRQQQEIANNNIEAEKSNRYTYNSQISSLANEIDKLELDIKEKEKDIERKNKEIELHEKEIQNTTMQITMLEKEFQNKKVQVDERLLVNYKSIYDNNLLTAMVEEPDSTTYNELAKYYQYLRNKERDQMNALKDEQITLNIKREEIKDSKVEVEKIAFAISEEKESLVNLEQTLGAQITWKEKLVETSKQNENYYSNQIDSLSSEEEQLIEQFNETQNAIFAAMHQVDAKVARKVSKGDPIGREGCTGICTGPHLHFFTDINGDGVNDNPCNYLPAGTFSSCGTSSPTLDWPMKGTFYYTSGFGWRNLGWYSSYHSAIDIAYPWGATNDLIYAAHDGYVTYGQQSCGGASICNGGYANYAIICSDLSCSMKSGYWHLE